MPLQRRLPKRGFTNIFKKRYAVINIRDLARFESGATVDATMLLEAGLIQRRPDGVKLLGQGSLDASLVVRVNQCSKSAKAKLEAAGGRIELI
jgi:large subunit ribosomal protein L15